MNKVQIIGRLGKDPENNNGVVKFSVATSEKFTDKDGNKKENTEWFNVVAFGKLGEICERFLLKGSQVYCEGKQQTQLYNEKYYTSLVLRDMEMLGSKSEPKDQPTPADYKEPVNNDGPEDDLPF